LVLRFSSMGDIVLTSPVLRCLKSQVPNVQIHYATKKQFHDLLLHNPFVEKIHLLEKGKTAEFIKELKQEKFDLIVDLHHNLRTLRIKFALGVASKSFPKLNREKWLAVRFKNKGALPQMHVVDRYLQTVAHLGVKNDGLGLDFFAGKTILPDAMLKFQSKSYVVYGIGGQHATKRLPLNKMQELFTNLTLPLVLLGGKEDFDIGEALRKLLPEKEIENACGQISILQSALVVKHSSWVVSHDTAIMHVGAAFQKPVYSLWGNTIPEFGMTPYFGENSSAESLSKVFEVENLPCRPCSKIGFASCPKGHFDCMNKQDFSDVHF
jgi:ADP-heptose:LPS heptosyltransferase